MRFMILVKATADSEAGKLPHETLMEMAGYHEELARAGVLLDAAGLQPSTKAWRVRYDGSQRTLSDGPFAATEALVAGYTLIQVRSRDEAVEWVRRFPNPAVGGGRGEIEVRQLFELDDFAPGEAIERLRDLKLGSH